MPAASTRGVRLPAAACSLALVLLSLCLSICRVRVLLEATRQQGSLLYRFQNVALPELEEPVYYVLVVG